MLVCSYLSTFRLTLEMLEDIRDPLDSAAAAQDDMDEDERRQAEERSAALTQLLDELHAEKKLALQEEDYERAAAVKKVWQS